MQDIKQFIVGFFTGLKCEIIEREGITSIRNIPEKIQKLLNCGKEATLNFDNSGKGLFVNEDSDFFIKIRNYLKNNSSKTLLKIDFEFPKNIKDKIPLRNCSISKVEKKHENNYFSRFTFLTNLRSMNHVEQVTTEIFVHEGKVVKGDLNDYKIQEGKVEEASTEHLANDYNIAKEKLKEELNKAIEVMSKSLNEGLAKETQRIEEHYKKITDEFELNKKRTLERMKELQDYPDSAEKIKRLNEILATTYANKELDKIKNEMKVVVDNEKSKYSLDIENKLVNTTIIYYPIFKVNLGLSESGFNKILEVTYNPLTDEMSNFVCDSCKTLLDQINVCHGGHICCSSCLHLCSECGKRFCRLCLSGMCNNCGKLICKNCSRKCPDCGKINCKNCMRKVERSGVEKCAVCVVYCPGCSKIVDKKQLVRGSDGRMICRDCGSKKR